MQNQDENPVIKCCLLEGTEPRTEKLTRREFLKSGNSFYMIRKKK